MVAGERVNVFKIAITRGVFVIARNGFSIIVP